MVRERAVRLKTTHAQMKCFKTVSIGSWNGGTNFRFLRRLFDTRRFHPHGFDARKVRLRFGRERFLVALLVERHLVGTPLLRSRREQS
jgi:hypothetical protein